MYLIFNRSEKGLKGSEQDFLNKKRLEYAYSRFTLKSWESTKPNTQNRSHSKEEPDSKKTIKKKLRETNNPTTNYRSELGYSTLEIQ